MSVQNPAVRSPGRWRLTPVRFMVLAALGFLFYFARAAFVPVALALLLALVLSAPVEALHRARVPRMVSATLILVVVLAALAGAANLLWSPVNQWVASAPHTARIVKNRIKPVAVFMNRIDSLRQSAASIGDTGTARNPARPQVVALPTESVPMRIFDAMRGVAVGSLTAIIVTLFLLAGGPPMLARMTAAFASDWNASHALGLIEKVRAELGRFYATTALINLGLGCATTGIMAAWGMPTPYLWGALAAVLNFIPYAGSAVTLLVITLVAVVSFDSAGTIFAVAASYLALATIEGQLVSPLLVGRRLALNPLLVFLALWFAGLYWGIAGIILATPALVALKVVAENSPNGKSMLAFLGPYHGQRRAHAMRAASPATPASPISPVPLRVRDRSLPASRAALP